jgi:hypothetical protein
VTITSKLLRYEKTGKNGRTGLVGVTNDNPTGIRIFEATGIPARYNGAAAWTWIQSHYTNQFMWDHGQVLLADETHVWQLLWDVNDTISSIDADILACEVDKANCVLAGVAELRTISSNIIARQEHIFLAQRDMLSAVVRIIKSMSPNGHEAEG